MKKEILKKAKNIKLICMDVDGVLTQGELIVLESGEEIKIWDIKDRFAFTLLKKFTPEIKLAWISGRDSNQIRSRAKEFGIDYLYTNCSNKEEAFDDLLKKTNLKKEEVAFMGDDFLDAPILRKACLSACPKDAPKEIRRIVDKVTKSPGGKGAFREFVTIILTAKGLWNKIKKEYKL